MNGADSTVEGRGISNWGWKERKDLGAERRWGYVFWDEARRGLFGDLEHGGELEEWKIWSADLRESKTREVKGRWWSLSRSKKR